MPIPGMETLPYFDVSPSRLAAEMVKEAVSGEMLGDYRILTVHVTTPVEERTELIAKAYEESLAHFGEEIELLKKIELWSKERWEESNCFGDMDDIAEHMAEHGINF